jgi:capsular exopolysaccharide synthesis family protein
MSVQENLETISVKELIGKALSHWYWFAISLGVIVPLAYLYSLSLVPSYEVSAKLSLAEKNSDRLASDEGFKEYGLLTQYQKLEDRMQVLTSRNVVGQALENTQLDVAYYQNKPLSAIRVYPQEVPFYVVIDSTKPQLTDVKVTVSKGKTGFILTAEVEEQADLTNLQTQERVRAIGAMEIEVASDENGKVEHDYFNLEIVPNLQATEEFADDYAFKIRSIKSMVKDYQKKLTVEQIGDESSVVSITMSGPLPYEEETFIDELMDAYIKSELKKREREGRRILAFVDSQLTVFEDSLISVQQQRVGYQTQKGVVSSSKTNDLITSEMLTQRNVQSSLRVDKLRYESVLRRMKAGDQNTMPSTQNIDDPLLRDQLSQLSDLLAQRADLEQNVTADNRKIKENETKIERTRENIIQSLEDLIASKKIELRETGRQIGNLRSEVKDLPEVDASIASLTEKISRIQSRYDYLSQKRSELLIALPAVSVDYFVIDEARTTDNTSGLSKGLVMIIAFILGIGIPTGILVVKEFLNDNLLTYKEVRRHTRIPIMGMIIKNDTPYPTLRPDTTDSALAECFRALRIHMYKNIPDEDRESIKVLGVVSTWSGEGKSFCAANMAASLAMAGYKTLIIDLDLRNPNQTRHFDYEPERGLSNTLPGTRTVDASYLPQPTHIPSLDIIAAGPVYHNPLDLFDGPAFRQLISQVRESYDFVILDLPPIAQASDYLLVSEFLDFTLYVARHHVTKVSDLERINELYNEGKIKYIGLVMNGVANPSYFRYGDMSYYNIGRYKKRYNSAYTAS